MNIMFIIPLFGLFIALAIFVFITFKKTDGDTDTTVLPTNEFTNIIDIKGENVYTRDNHVFNFIEIEPLSVDLLSNTERADITKMLSSEATGIDYEFKYFVNSRPVNIESYLRTFQEQIQKYVEEEQMIGDPQRYHIEKTILKEEMKHINQRAGKGEVVERIHIIAVWMDLQYHNESELLERSNDLMERLSIGGISTKRLDQDKGSEISNMINLIMNPVHNHLDINDVAIDTAFFPIIESGQ